MAEIMTADKLKKDILDDMMVELSDEFDKNFERKAFFTDAWKARKDPKANGSLLVVSVRLRRSIKGSVEGDGVRFTSDTSYATVHNEGGSGFVTVRQHQRKHYKTGKVYTVRSHQRRVNIPQRQFVGDGQRTQEIIRGVIDDNVKQFNASLSNFIRTNK